MGLRRSQDLLSLSLACLGFFAAASCQPLCFVEWSISNSYTVASEQSSYVTLNLYASNNGTADLVAPYELTIYNPSYVDAFSWNFEITNTSEGTINGITAPGNAFWETLLAASKNVVNMGGNVETTQLSEGPTAITIGGYQCELSERREGYKFGSSGDGGSAGSGGGNSDPGISGNEGSSNAGDSSAQGSGSNVGGGASGSSGSSNDVNTAGTGSGSGSGASSGSSGSSSSQEQNSDTSGSGGQTAGDGSNSGGQSSSGNSGSSGSGSSSGTASGSGSGGSSAANGASASSGRNGASYNGAIGRQGGSGFRGPSFAPRPGPIGRISATY